MHTEGDKAVRSQTRVFRAAMLLASLAGCAADERMAFAPLPPSASQTPVSGSVGPSAGSAAVAPTSPAPSVAAAGAGAAAAAGTGAGPSSPVSEQPGMGVAAPSAATVTYQRDIR